MEHLFAVEYESKIFKKLVALTWTSIESVLRDLILEQHAVCPPTLSGQGVLLLGHGNLSATIIILVMCTMK